MQWGLRLSQKLVGSWESAWQRGKLDGYDKSSVFHISTVQVSALNSTATLALHLRDTT